MAKKCNIVLLIRFSSQPWSYIIWNISVGLSLEQPLVRTLRDAGLDGRGARVILQSFETANLRELNRLSSFGTISPSRASTAVGMHLESCLPPATTSRYTHQRS